MNNSTSNGAAKSRYQTTQVYLGEPELRACQWLKKHGFSGSKTEKNSIAAVANLAVLFALAHPKEFRAWFDRAVWYKYREGVNAVDYMVAAIAKHPTYRRAMTGRH